MQRAGYWSGLLLLLLSAACRHESPASSTPGVAPPSATPVEAVSTTEPVPEVQGVYLTRAYRPEGLQSRALHFEVAEFRQRLRVGAALTLVPLGIDLPAVQSRVLSVQKTPDPCSDSLPPWWEVQIAPLTQPTYIQAASPLPPSQDAEHYPFEVAVLYPAIAQVRALNRGLLEVAALPPRRRAEQVLLALDFNGDAAPELVLVEYCCDKPQLPVKECDLTCRQTWLRTGGQWRVIDKGTPC
jgi:hypothetical protein